MFKKIYNKIGKLVNTVYGLPLLFCIFFAEAIFLFLPADPILILYCIHNRKRSFLFALVATTSMILGGIIAYYLGCYLWESVGDKVTSFINKAKFECLINEYKEHASLTIFIGTLTPLPYKIIAWSAGFAKLSFFPFLIFSLIGKGIRFFSIAILINIFGNRIQVFIDRYFNYLILLFTIIIFVVFYLLK